jgi:hypothetical protein
MSRMVQRVRAALFGAAVAGALAVGASAAAAEPGEARECYNPQAACRTPAECIAYCFPYGGRCNGLVVGGSLRGCCACNR